MKKLIILVILCLFLMGCVQQQPKAVHVEEQPTVALEETMEESIMAEIKIATLAGGCFWCVEHSLEPMDGVQKVLSGYAGGYTENPTYKDVTYGDTGHREAVQVYFDPSIVSYEDILRRFFMIIDPTDEGGQFADRGFSYTTAIFYHDEEQKGVAEEVVKDLQATKYNDAIVTPLIEYTNFFEAEDYHQDYSKKNPVRYKAYSHGSGRVGYIKDTWGDI